MRTWDKATVKPWIVLLCLSCAVLSMGCEEPTLVIGGLYAACEPEGGVDMQMHVLKQFIGPPLLHIELPPNLTTVELASNDFAAERPETLGGYVPAILTGDRILFTQPLQVSGDPSLDSCHIIFRGHDEDGDVWADKVTLEQFRCDGRDDPLGLEGKILDRRPNNIGLCE